MSHHTKCCNPHCENCVPKKCDIPHCERCRPNHWLRSEYTTKDPGIIRCPVKTCEGTMISIHGYIGKCRNKHVIRTAGNSLRLVEEFPKGAPMNEVTRDRVNEGWLRHFHRTNKPLS